MTEELLYAVYRRQDNSLHLLGEHLTLSELRPYTLKRAAEWNLDIIPVDCLIDEGPDCILVLKHEPPIPADVAVESPEVPRTPPLHNYYWEIKAGYNPNWREQNRRALDAQNSAKHIPWERIEQARQSAQQMPSGYDRNQQSPDFMNFSRREEALCSGWQGSCSSAGPWLSFRSVNGFNGGV